MNAVTTLLQNPREVAIALLAAAIGFAVLWVVAKYRRWTWVARRIEGLFGRRGTVASATGRDVLSKDDRQGRSAAKLSLWFLLPAVAFPLWAWVVAVVVLLLVARAGQPTLRDVRKHIAKQWDESWRGAIGWALMVGVLALVPTLIVVSAQLDLELPDIRGMEPVMWLRIAAAAQVLVAWTVGRIVRGQIRPATRSVDQVQLQGLLRMSDGTVEELRSAFHPQPTGGWIVTSIPVSTVAQRERIAREALELGLALRELSTQQAVFDLATDADRSSHEVLAATNGVLRAWPTVPTRLASEAQWVFDPQRGLRPNDQV